MPVILLEPAQSIGLMGEPMLSWMCASCRQHTDINPGDHIRGRAGPVWNRTSKPLVRHASQPTLHVFLWILVMVKAIEVRVHRGHRAMRPLGNKLGALLRL